MFHKVLRRYGITATISVLTLISILLSVAVTLVVDYFLRGNFGGALGRCYFGSRIYGTGNEFPNASCH